MNLGSLTLLRLRGVHTNLAAALAIEISVLSNFTINHLWTFGDRHEARVSLWHHGLRFHLVSLGSGAIQLLVFVAMNMAWPFVLGDETAIAAHRMSAGSFTERWLWRPFVAPVEVGKLIYVSQLCGIGAALAWNYLLNFYWTWATRERRAA